METHVFWKSHHGNTHTHTQELSVKRLQQQAQNNHEHKQHKNHEKPATSNLRKLARGRTSGLMVEACGSAPVRSPARFARIACFSTPSTECNGRLQPEGLRRMLLGKGGPFPAQKSLTGVSSLLGQLFSWCPFLPPLPWDVLFGTS